MTSSQVTVMSWRKPKTLLPVIFWSITAEAGRCRFDHFRISFPAKAHSRQLRCRFLAR
jgi:hypothetical protein